MRPARAGQGESTSSAAAETEPDDALHSVNHGLRLTHTMHQQMKQELGLDHFEGRG